MKSKDIKIEHSIVTIDNKPQVIYSGEFHYFRVPRKEWRIRLSRASALGVNCISIYVPWNWHEIKENSFCWSDNRNLQEVLFICNELDLYVIIKPGPYICAEWDFGGFPDWLMSKEVVLRSPEDRYMSYVKTWYKEVISQIKPYLITNSGSIIMFQIENEYEHYIDFAEDCLVSLEEGKRYIGEMLKFSKREGIDIPFCMNGSPKICKEFSIINGLDFWGDIPFLWSMEFNLFNKMLDDMRINNEPVFIAELQAGWYDQLGQSHYEATEILGLSIRNAIAYRTSIINIFMLLGGTTPPNYNCKGDSLLCESRENTSSYDFGAPIREDGGLNIQKCKEVLMGKKFVDSYKDLILNGCFSNRFKVRLENIEYKSFESTSLDYEIMLKNYGVIYRCISLPNKNLLYLANLSNKNELLKIVDTKTNTSVSIELKRKTAKLLPIDYRIANITICWSDSEIFYYQDDENDMTNIFVVTDELGKGRLRILCDNKLKANNSSIQIKSIDNEYYDLVCFSKEISYVETIGVRIFFVSQEEAHFIKIYDDCIVFPGEKLIIDKECLDNDINFETMGLEKNLDIKLFSKERKNISVTIDGFNVALKTINKTEGMYQLDYESSGNNCNAKKRENLANWNGSWEAINLDSIIDNDSIERDWREIDVLEKIENIGGFRHGYIFYKIKFKLENLENNYSLIYNGGENYKSYIYLNGQLVYAGQAVNKLSNSCEQCIDISEFIKEENDLTIKYLYHFHTKGYQNSGKLLQYSGIEKLGIKSISNSDSFVALNKASVACFPLDNVDVFHNQLTDINTLSESTGYVFGTKNLVYLKRQFSFSKPEANIEFCLNIKLQEVNERALIYINKSLIGKYEVESPQRVFYIPMELLKEDNIVEIILEGKGFNYCGVIEYPSLGSVELVPSFYSFKNILKISRDCE